MHVTLSRNEYSAAIRRQLAIFLTPEGVARTMATQYPKPSGLATAELRYRGAAASELPDSMAYGAAQIDAMAEALELTGHLTTEAQLAQVRGLSLAAWREATADPAADRIFDSATNGGRLPMVEGGPRR